MIKISMPKPMGKAKPGKGSSRKGSVKTPTFKPPAMPPIKPGKSGK